jgi:hypothetical protein
MQLDFATRKKAKIKMAIMLHYISFSITTDFNKLSEFSIK